MGVIDKLTYEIGYDTDDASLKKSQTGFKSLIGMAKKLTGFIVAVNGAMFGLATTTAKYGDQVAKTSSKLGIGVEELQEYRFAAERAGVSQTTFDMAIQRSTRRISEAAAGMGAAKDALIELGLSAEELNKLSPDEQLDAISKAFDGVANQADKVRLAMKLFDTEGVQLVNLLSMTEEQTRAAKEEFRAMGGVLSEEAAKDAEVFTDAMGDVSTIISGVGRLIGAQLLKPLSEAVKLFKEWWIANYDIIRSGILVFVDAMTTAFGALWSIVKLFINILSGIVTIFNDMGEAGKWFFGGAALAGVVSVVGGFSKLAVILLTISKTFALIALKFAAWTAVLLVIEDIVTWLQDGDSVLGEWIGSVGEVRMVLTDMFMAIDIWFTDLGKKWDDIWTLDESTLQTLDKIANFIPGVEGRKKAMTPAVAPSSAYAKMLAGPTVNTTANINVAGSGDPTAVAKAVKYEINKQNTEALGASTGAGY